MVKPVWRHLGFILLCAGVVAAQDQPPAQQPETPPPQQPAPSEQPTRPTLNRPSDQPNRPTLGEGPSLGGPHNPNTSDPHRLLRVHSIFIEQMDNGLAEKLIEDIGNKAVFRIVANRRDADAILHGTCFDSARLKTVHSEVFLRGRDGDSIWQDVVHQPYRPPPLTEAVATTAEAIAQDLAQSFREAQRK